MNIEVLRKKLHDFVDNADEAQLESMHQMLIEDTANEQVPDEEMIEELDKRWNNYKSGNSRTYTLEEAREELHSYRKNQD